MKKLIILLSIAIAASSFSAHASKPAQQTPSSSGKSWLGPVLMGGGAAIGIGSYLLQKSATTRTHRIQKANEIIKNTINENKQQVATAPKGVFMPEQVTTHAQSGEVVSQRPAQTLLVPGQVLGYQYPTLVYMCRVAKLTNSAYANEIQELQEVYARNQAPVSAEGYIPFGSSPFYYAAINAHVHSQSSTLPYWAISKVGAGIAAVGAWFTFKK